MILNWLSLVDVGFVLVAVFVAWAGAQKGFAAQVPSLLTFVIMGGVLFFVYPVIFNYYDGVFRNMEETYLIWAILAGLVVVAFLIFMLFSKLLEGLLETKISEKLDHVYGSVLGLIRGAFGALFAMILLVILDPSGNVYEAFSARSKVGRLVCYEIVPRIQPHMSRSVLGEKADKIRNKLLEQEEAGVYM